MEATAFFNLNRKPGMGNLETYSPDEVLALLEEYGGIITGRKDNHKVVAVSQTNYDHRPDTWRNRKPHFGVCMNPLCEKCGHNVKGDHGY